MGYIYKIIQNKDKKPIYVGQTIKTPQERWKEHLIFSFRKNRKNSFKIHDTIRKYGANEFSLESIEEVENELLNSREEFWIQTLHTHVSEGGCNLTWGGENCSDSLKRKCYQYDRITNLFLQEFLSVSDAARAVKGAANNIVKVLNGQLYTAYGYRWSYEKLDSLKPLISNHTGASKTVYQYDLNKNFIQSFPSTKEAGRILNKSQGTISMAANGKRKTAYGYIWSYIPL